MNNKGRHEKLTRKERFGITGHQKKMILMEKLKPDMW
jgi:hypothetical protein